MFQAFKSARIASLEDENRRLNHLLRGKDTIILTLRHQNAQFAKELAKLKATPRKKKRVVTKAVTRYDGYRQLDVEGVAHHVANLMAAMKLNGIQPRKGLERMRWLGYLDENNRPRTVDIEAARFIMKGKQAYAHHAGVKWIGELKEQGIFAGLHVKKG